MPALFLTDTDGRGREVCMEIVATERRTNRRYDLRLPVHYRVSEKGAVPRTGTGTTCDLSSNGLSFRCRKSLPVGAHIEVIIEWPSRYGDIYPIELQVTGFIVRCSGGRIGVQVASRRFRVDTAPSVPIRATA